LTGWRAGRKSAPQSVWFFFGECFFLPPSRLQSRLAIFQQGFCYYSISIRSESAKWGEMAIAFEENEKGPLGVYTKTTNVRDRE